MTEKPINLGSLPDLDDEDSKDFLSEWEGSYTGERYDTLPEPADQTVKPEVPPWGPEKPQVASEGKDGQGAVQTPSSAYCQPEAQAGGLSGASTVDPGEVVDRAILEVENVLLANKVPQNIIRELPKPYYEDDGVIIYNCRCEEVLLSTLSDSVDLCLTDPPYDKKTHERIMTSGDSGKGELSDVGFNYITIEKMYEIFGQVSRICNKWTILTLDLEHAIRFYKQAPSGMEYIRWGIYHKTHHAPQYSGDRPSMGWEPIAIMHRAGKKKVWNGGGTDSVFTYKPPMRGIHPTQKSESFYSDIMKLFTNPGDTVFDPFMGGGTTAICARRMGRKAICVEMQEKYCEAVAKQLQQVDINTFVHRKIKNKQDLLISKDQFSKKEKK